ncbi:hypothetical protein HDU67_004712 [Dinochytrium kinnereticum]|nr:hypothetical protein HDU67_004712 [Dinochytrium kinnereticum]
MATQMCNRPGCAMECYEAMSRTEKNPNRPFWRCPEHGFNGWNDASTSSSQGSQTQSQAGESSQLVASATPMAPRTPAVNKGQSGGGGSSSSYGGYPSTTADGRGASKTPTSQIRYTPYMTPTTTRSVAPPRRQSPPPPLPDSSQTQPLTLTPLEAEESSWDTHSSPPVSPDLLPVSSSPSLRAAGRFSGTSSLVVEDGGGVDEGFEIAIGGVREYVRGLREQVQKLKRANDGFRRALERQRVLGERRNRFCEACLGDMK